jgi:hypothetical protein
MANATSSEVIIVTLNDATVRSELHRDYDPLGLELVNSQGTYITWHWTNPDAASLAAIQARTEHLGTVEIPAHTQG